MDFGSKTALLRTCTTLAMIMLPAAVVAQQAAPVEQGAAAEGSTVLNTIVVKGKRVPAGSVSDTPLATQTTAEDVAKNDIQTLDDLGNTTEPGVSFVESTQSVNIRGLEDDRVLTTIDGIPIPYLSDAVRGSYGGANTFDFASLSTIDVLRGGDSSRAGSGALGGALVLRTLEPEDLIGEGRDWGAIAKLGFDGTEDAFYGSAAVAKRVENTSILFQGSYKRGHERRTGGDVGGTGPLRTEADPEDYDQRNFLVKLRQDLEGGHQVGITAEHFNFDGTTDLRSEQGATYAPGNYDGNRENTRNRVSLDYRFDSIAEDSLISSAFATLYWQKAQRIEGTEGERLTAPRGDWMRSSENEEEAFGFNGYFNSDFATGALSHRLTVGTDVQFSTTSQYMTGRDNCATDFTFGCMFYHNNQADMPETDGTKVGVFAEDRIEFGATGLSLTPGVRLDWIDFSPQDTAGWRDNSGDDTLPGGRDFFRVSPKLRAAWQVRSDVELFAQFSSGFKAPNAAQLYSNYDNSPFYRQIGNPDLDEETSYGVEVGANVGTDDFGGRVSAFSTRYKDFIDISDPEVIGGVPTYYFFNRANVRISGVEARGRKTFANGMVVHGSVAYARGEDLDTGELIASVAPIKGIFGVGYETETWGTDVSLIAAGAVSEKSSATIKPAGYGIVNLTGWWEPEQVKGLRLQAGVYNVFDKTYFDALEVKDLASASDFDSEPGRTFKISLTQRF